MNERLYATFEGFEIGLLRGDVKYIAQQGSNDAAVEDTLLRPYIKKQLRKIGEEKIKTELKHWGAWSEEERNDHEENKRRIVWCAAWNIEENLREEKILKRSENNAST